MTSCESGKRFLFAVICVLLIAGYAHGESKHPFGIHFFYPGAAADVQSHRTGWCVEANVTAGGGGPDINGRIKPATAQGYTILQRLDWKWEQTIPLGSSDQDAFASQCANWANSIKNYCRTYSIGNEVEFFDVTPSIYAACFLKVRNAIKAVQPDAKVIIGHMNSTGNQQSVMQILGTNGYDGVTAHVSNYVPTGLLDILDAENAPPGVGVYITEWGWQGEDTNAMGKMQSFYLGIGQSNATRARQIYCACWFVYYDPYWESFALRLQTQYNNPAFEAATAIGTSVNEYASNPVIISNLYADIPDHGSSMLLSWNTNVAARRQVWWTRQGLYGPSWEKHSDLVTNQTTSHQQTISSLSANTSYEVMPNSTKSGYADAGGRRYLVRTGPWLNTITQAGANKAAVTWQTSWPATSRVDFGPTSALGQTATDFGLNTNHSVTLNGLSSGTLYYRILSGETNSDGDAVLLMRSPTRTFVLGARCVGDIDDDGDVDLDDYGELQRCYSGAGVTQSDPTCTFALLDTDDDVDAADLNVFLNAMTGSGVPCVAE